MTESTSRGAARPLRRDPAEDGTPAAPSSREGPASFDFEPRPIPPALPRSAPFPRRVVRWVVRIGYGLWIHDATSAANSMAFNFFLSVIPLLVLVGFLLGLLGKGFFLLRLGQFRLFIVVFQNFRDSKANGDKSTDERGPKKSNSKF